MVLNRAMGNAGRTLWCQYSRPKLWPSSISVSREMRGYQQLWHHHHQQQQQQQRPLLAHEWIVDGRITSSRGGEKRKEREVIIFLHGLLGNAKNLRTPAKILTRRLPQYDALLLDVRGHGGSSSSSHSIAGNSLFTRPHNIQSCVQDVIETLLHLGLCGHDASPSIICGHSLGGRIALHYTHSLLHHTESTSRIQSPKQTWILDSVPGIADPSVSKVLSAISSLTTAMTPSSSSSATASVPTKIKSQISTKLVDEYGLDIQIATWIVSSLRAIDEQSQRLIWTFDIDIAMELVKIFTEQDMVGMIREVVESSSKSTITAAKDNNHAADAEHSKVVQLVMAGKNESWTERIISELHTIQSSSHRTPSSSFKMHKLEKAGHWVHVDDLDGLMQLMVDELRWSPNKVHSIFRELLHRESRVHARKNTFDSLLSVTAVEEGARRGKLAMFDRSRFCRSSLHLPWIEVTYNIPSTPMMMLSRASLTFGRRHLSGAATAGTTNSAAYWFSSTSAALQQYDVVVIGGGPGGYVAAIKAGQLGLKTACVEMRGTLGGTCLNVGCIPSKALLTSSHHFHDAKHHFADHGIHVGELTMDVSKMLDAKAKTVQGLTGGIEHLLKKHKVDYFVGKGSLTGPNGVAVALNAGGSENLETKNIIIATGSEVTPLPPVPVDNAGGKIVDSTGALDISKIPNSMAVIGGGVIGLEMGSVWSRLGSKVTVIEFMDRLCPAMDQELTKKFQTTLKKQGFNFKLKTKVVKSEVVGDSVAITTEPSKGGEQVTENYDVVLVATGRRPYTAGLGLENLGIQTDKLGRIEVDSHFRTAVPSIYAIGDCIDGPMLAHKAEEEGIAAVETIAGFAGHVNYDAIPGVIYTFPEVASVGKTEEELKESNIEYNKGTFPFAANSRARANATGNSEGFVKILADKTTDKILGVHIMGPNAGEMIAEGVLGMEYGASSEDVARTCHAHPTLSEAFKEACMDAYDKPIHF